MIKNSMVRFLSLIFFLGSGGIAVAHPGHGSMGFSAGLAHPLTGTDHLLAMVAVGLWAAQTGGRRVWLLPATFLLMLMAGAGLAHLFPSLPLIEPGIAASVLILGLVIALSLKVPALFSIVMTALFGLLHGYAHGAEMPASMEPAAYALGFLTTTATLHLGGIAVGILSRSRFTHLAKMLGVAIAVSGAWMLSSI